MLNTNVVQPTEARPYEGDKRLVSFLENEMGFKLTHVDLEEVVNRLYRSVKEFDSFESFASAVSSLIAVHETYFLRHHEQFKWIEDVWFMQMLKDREHVKGPIRILCAGCSTGEEPYSIYSHLAHLSRQHGVDIFVDAVDISENALDIAKKGKYGLWSLRGVSIEEESRWLDVKSRHVIVKEWVKEGVVFKKENITKPFFVNRPDYYDLILCRNVMIYMHAEAVENIFLNLRALLKTNGHILPGPSDPNPANIPDLKLIWADGVRLFKKNNLPEKSLTFEDAASPVNVNLEKRLTSNTSASSFLFKKDTPTNKDKTESVSDDLISINALRSFNSYQSIEALMKSCEYDSARKLLGGNIKSNPLDVRSYVMLAMLALDLDDLPLAKLSTQKASFLSPNSPYVMYLLANYKQRIGEVRAERRDLLCVKEQLKTMDRKQVVEFCEELLVEELEGVVDARIK